MTEKKERGWEWLFRHLTYDIQVQGKLSEKRVIPYEHRSKGCKGKHRKKIKSIIGQMTKHL